MIWDKQQTHNPLAQPNSIHTMKNSVVKVVRIDFAVILELVEEVKEVEGKRRRGTVDCCWKQTCAEQLNVPGCGITIAVSNDQTVNTR